MTRRKLPEWIGATPDAKIPKRVQLRVFDAHKGKCHISGRKIGRSDTWELDHIRAICNGGENRESNLAPALTYHHKAKTKIDVATKAKDDRIRKKHLGIYKPRARIPGSKGSGMRKKMNGTVVWIDE